MPRIAGKYGLKIVVELDVALRQLAAVKAGTSDHPPEQLSLCIR
jgi:hypothetical protein